MFKCRAPRSTETTLLVLHTKNIWTVLEYSQENTKPAWQIPYLLPQMLNPLLPFSSMTIGTPDFSSFTVCLQMTLAQHTSPWGPAAPDQPHTHKTDVEEEANTRECSRIYSWMGSVKQSDKLLQFSKNMATIGILRHYQLQGQRFLFRLK